MLRDQREMIYYKMLFLQNCIGIESYLALTNEISLMFRINGIDFLETITNQWIYITTLVDFL